mmetsp:Transcript_13377/g.26743  ORF Transcript_13377/g.26743 Transcript_13377/m.26743 type:complete len:373 (-) Transcript_13377:92-1210(-)
MQKSVDPTAPQVVHAQVVPPQPPVAVQAEIVNSGAAPQQHEGIESFQNEGGAREFLSAQGFPAGLQDAFVESLRKLPMRFFIVDDSGSMSINDGKRVVTRGTKKAMLACSRWVELTESLKFHVNFARQASAPTEFRLLNGAAPVKVGTTDAGEADRCVALNAILEGSPGGATPLCRHIREVSAQIRAAEGELRRNGQRACLIIATDGEASDGNISQAMAPLKDLPVWVVVRLCTDEEKIVNYWNGIDEELELSMDVLDDLSGEAAEVHAVNPWLTYGEPMHRLREFGILIKEMDVMDSDKLSLDQIRKFCSIIFGGAVDNYPHPELDFKAFLTAVDGENKRTFKVWDPMTKRPKDWIDKKKLGQLQAGCIVC